MKYIFFLCLLFIDFFELKSISSQNTKTEIISGNTVLTETINFSNTKITFAANKEIIINGNGHTLNLNQDNKNIIELEKNTHVTFKNMTLDNFNPHDFSFAAGSELTIGPNVFINLEKDISFEDSLPAIAFAGKNTINANHHIIIFKKQHGIQLLSRSELKIKNGKIKPVVSTPFFVKNSNLVLQDTEVFLKNNFCWQSGTIRIKKKVKFYGPNTQKTEITPQIILSDSGKISIKDRSTLTLSSGTNFIYSPMISSIFAEPSIILETPLSTLSLNNHFFHLTTDLFLKAGKLRIKGNSCFYATKEKEALAKLILDHNLDVKIEASAQLRLLCPTVLKKPQEETKSFISRSKAKSVVLEKSWRPSKTIIPNKQILSIQGNGYSIILDNHKINQMHLNKNSTLHTKHVVFDRFNFQSIQAEPSAHFIFDDQTAIFLKQDVSFKANLGKYTFAGNTKINGSGNNLKLCAQNALNIAKNSTLTLKNLKLILKDEKAIHLEDTSSCLRLENCTIEIATERFTFEKGNLELSGNCRLMGTASTFSFISPGTITIKPISRFKIGKTINFQFFSQPPDNETEKQKRRHFIMIDHTSTLHLSGCTLEIGQSGMSLDQGNLIINKDISLLFPETRTNLVDSFLEINDLVNVRLSCTTKMKTNGYIFLSSQKNLDDKA